MILNVLATFSHEITSLDHVEFKLHQVFPDLYHSRVYTKFNPYPANVENRVRS